MSGKDRTETKAENTRVVQEKHTETKYEIEQLQKNCVTLFGVTSSTFAGAMYGHNETQYTINEVKAIIDKFLKGGN